MKKFATYSCPVCQARLHVARLACPECKAEFPVYEEVSKFEILTEEQKNFLITFLKCEGSIKQVGEKLQISYPTVKKRYDELLTALGINEEKQNKIEEKINMSVFENLDKTSNKPSDIIKTKLFYNNGVAIIPLQSGDMCKIYVSSDGKGFLSDKLGTQKIDFEVFDIVVDFLKEQGGKAPKGMGRGKEKVGEGKCGLDTVVGAVATRYYGKQVGEATFDPVFVLAAILEWAGIAKNGWGYIQLK
ncbi:MAG: DUF2089 domain-containing protein [Clostridia bacterium]|nr:DUF2089 domain-containing protein [Clostridia bacterium]